jgi:hypothetical protein
MQDGPSGLSDVSQQILVEVLPPVLVLHLNRVRYDATAGGLMKIGKSIQFGPELEIPLGTVFIFVAIADAEYFVIWSFQTSWYRILNDRQSHRITSSMECCTITGNLQAAGTIRLTSFARTETATQGKIGCTSIMKQ